MDGRLYLPRCVLAVLATLACACGDEPRPALQIAVAASPSAEVLHLAQARELFVTEGVKVRLVEHTSSGDVLKAFERGQVDGMLTSVVEVLHARDAGKRAPEVVMVTDAAGADGAVLARPPLAMVTELRGLRVAADPRSLSLYVLLETLARSGVPLSDVTLVPADSMAMPRLLGDGSVDAVVSSPPWTQQILRAGAGRPLGDGHRGTVALEVLVFDRTVVRDRPADVAAVLRAWDRGLASLAADPEGATKLMAARERLTVREFGGLLAQARLLRSDQQDPWLAPGGTLAHAVARVSRLLRENGQLTGPDRAAEPLAPPAAAPRGAG
jgi:NitT/TauT family transport system substrate-binding protein